MHLLANIPPLPPPGRLIAVLAAICAGGCAPLDPTFSPSKTEPGTSLLPATQVREAANAEWSALTPAGYDYPEVFDGYWPGSTAAWARNWTRKIDLTGVAWDKPQAGTLISPRHILFARHFPRSTGETITFHDRRGKPVTRTLQATLPVAGIQLPDLVVGLLDAEVPLPHYRLLPPRADWGALLQGTGVFIATAQSKLLTARIHHIANGRLSFTHQGTTNQYLVDDLQHGDSGHPAFLVLRGEAILLETHSHGGFGSGPFVSDPVVFAAINRSMQVLGGGFQLETAAIDPTEALPGASPAVARASSPRSAQ